MLSYSPRVDPREDGHSLGCAEGEWKLFWACLRKDGCYVGLANYQVQVPWVLHVYESYVVLDVPDCKVQEPQVWHACQTHVILDLGLAYLLDLCYLVLRWLPSPSALSLIFFSKPTLSRFLGHEKRGWSFFWVFIGRMSVHRSMPGASLTANPSVSRA